MHKVLNETSKQCVNTFHIDDFFSHHIKPYVLKKKFINITINVNVTIVSYKNRLLDSKIHDREIVLVAGNMFSVDHRSKILAINLETL